MKMFQLLLIKVSKKVFFLYIFFLNKQGIHVCHLKTGGVGSLERGEGSWQNLVSDLQIAFRSTKRE